jgi:hypothetical protein
MASACIIRLRMAFLCQEDKRPAMLIGKSQRGMLQRYES